jgi:hypothetical protein
MIVLFSGKFNPIFKVFVRNSVNIAPVVAFTKFLKVLV